MPLTKPQIGMSDLILRDTAATASGSFMDYTVPVGVKRITVMFNGISTNGTAYVQIQVGSGSITNSGYSCVLTNLQNNSAVNVQTTTNGIAIYQNNAGEASFGTIVLTNITGNIWVASGNLGCVTTLNVSFNVAGSISLAGVLDKIRITTANGIDTFDAGQVNLFYE